MIVVVVAVVIVVNSNNNFPVILFVYRQADVIFKFVKKKIIFTCTARTFHQNIISGAAKWENVRSD